MLSLCKIGTLGWEIFESRLCFFKDRSRIILIKFLHPYSCSIMGLLFDFPNKGMRNCQWYQKSRIVTHSKISMSITPTKFSSEQNYVLWMTRSLIIFVVQIMATKSVLLAWFPFLILWNITFLEFGEIRRRILE